MKLKSLPHCNSIDPIVFASFLPTPNRSLSFDNIKLPKDSLVKNQLIASLNNFLQQKDKANKENRYVLKEDLLETSALLGCR